MTEKTVVARLRLEIDQYLANAKRAGAATRDLGREISGAGTTGKADLDKIGRSALLMAGGLTAAFVLSGKAAVDWESDWAGVTKTVEGTAAQMAGLEDGLRDLAGELPATHGEIAAVAEAAGALGIQTSAIEGFTKTMIDLGETTDVTADQAATAFARIANIMGTAQTDFDRMGSTLVELGNNGASTESEILELANRLAAAGNIAGLTEADILAMASSLASVGVEAEAGGTALSKVFTSVSDAVLDGSEKLDTFARVAGQTSEQFAASFRDDPAMAIDDFVSGLGRMIESGQSLTPVFEELELTDIRLMNALKSTAGAGDLLTESLRMGRQAWEDNNALQTEAEKRYDTTAAKLEIARNNVVDLAINVGDRLLPALSGAADAASTTAQGFSEMPGPLQTATLGIGGVATAGLGMAAGAAILIPKIRELRIALLTMGAAGRAASTAMPWLAAAAAAVAAVSFVFGQNARRAEEAEEATKGFTDAIREAGDATQGTRSHLEDMVAETPALSELLEATDTSLDDLQAGLTGAGAAFETFKQGLLESADAAGVSKDAMALAMFGMDGFRDSALGGADEAERLGRLIGDTGDAAAGAAPPVGSLAGELGLSADEAERAREEFEDLLDAYRGSVDPLFGMLDALSANREALGAEAAAREDATVTAEELAAMYQAVAESALDVEIRARELALAIADGTVSVEAAKGMLAEWVDQGLITEAQAAKVSEQFAAAAYTAELFAGDYVATVVTNAAAVGKEIDTLTRKLVDLSKVPYPILYGTLPPPPSGGVGGKGILYRAAGGWIPKGTDTVPAMLTPGEGIVTTKGMSMLGPSGLDAINTGRVGERIAGAMFAGNAGGSYSGLTAPTGGGGGSTSYDQSRHVTLQAPIEVIGATSPVETAERAVFRLRRTALELNG